MIRVRPRCLVGISFALLASISSLADEKVATKPAIPTKVEKVEKENVEKEKGNIADRLPRNWGDLDLSEEQKEKIYAIQRRAKPTLEAAVAEMSKIREQLARQREQMEALRKQVEAERIAILTDAQRKELADVQQKSRDQLRKVLAEKKEASKAAKATKPMPQNGK